MMGNGFQEKCDDVRPITALWTLTDLDNSYVIHGTSAETEGHGGLIGSTGEQIRTIGSFRGEKGHRYRVELTVTSAAPALANVSGKLEVGIGDTSFESALVLEQMAIFFTPIVFVVCGGVIGICVYLKGRASSAKRESL
jgi:hypothetical protein